MVLRTCDCGAEDMWPVVLRTCDCGAEDMCPWC